MPVRYSIGRVRSAISELMVALETRANRERLLRDMQTEHQRLCEIEDQQLRARMPINDLFPETK